MLSKQANEASLAFFSFLRFLQIWSRQKQPSGDNTEASKCQNQWPCSESSGSREIVCDRWCCLLDLTECSPNIDRNASVFQSVWTRCPLIGWIWSLENEFSWLPSKKNVIFLATCWAERSNCFKFKVVTSQDLFGWTMWPARGPTRFLLFEVFSVKTNPAPPSD